MAKSKTTTPAPAPDAPPVRLVELARSFPVLKDAPLENLRALATWSQRASNGQRVAVRFVLSVYNTSSLPNKKLGLGAFDVHEALRVWDGPNRAAFSAWVADPWWA